MTDRFFKTIARVALRLMCAMIIVVSAACSDPSGLPSGGLRIVNATTDSVAIIALSEEFSAVIDQIIEPTPVSEFRGTVVPPSTSRTLSADRISGWRGTGGIFIQTWCVDSGVARFRDERFLPAAEIRQLRGVVMVTPVTLCQPSNQ